MKLTSLLQFVDKFQQAGKIDNLQQGCGIFGCVVIVPLLLMMVMVTRGQLFEAHLA